MILPNYKGENTVNLISSIAQKFGTKTKYPELKFLKPEDLKENVVLLIIDGLGYEYIKYKGKGTIFKKYLKEKITSTFPSATSSANTTLLTGQTPEDHTVAGWYLYLKENKKTILSLPFITRERTPLRKKLKNTYNFNPVTKRIKNSYFITIKELANSEFSKAAVEGARRIGSKNKKDFFKKIEKTIKLKKKKKYIIAYWPNFDLIGHDNGVKSKKCYSEFKKLDLELKKLVKKTKNTNTTIIVTADHGMVDIKKKNIITINDHPKLESCLKTTVGGDPRYAYCFVKNNKKKYFERYVKTKFKKQCSIYKSKELVKKGYFGLNKPNKKFLDRIGDFTIIMKDFYSIYQFTDYEGRSYLVGDHGGLSKKEMLVPLIIINN